MTPESTPVLIVGAGPTGMALSIALLQRGVKHILIDRLEQGQNTSRAGVIHAQTLESLRPLGVSEQLVALGLKQTTFSIRDRDRALLRLPFDGLPTEHSYLLMLPQNVTEAVLAERIAALGGEVRRGVTAEHVEQDAQGARVTVSRDGQQSIIRADWVVGADGAHSLVRRAAGVELEGDTYPESFVLADVHLDRAPAPDEVSLYFSPAGMLVVAPLPDGSFRVVATLERAPEQPQARDIQALFDTRGPAGRRCRVLDVTWSSRFRVHHRLASAYRAGRLLLMGDAAHVHSPAGGQGMNTGIIDAIVLGQLLGEVINGERRPEELDLYERKRRPAAAEVLQLSRRLTALATVQGTLQRRLRNALLTLLGELPFARRRIALGLSGLSRAALAKVAEPAVHGSRPRVLPSSHRAAAAAAGTREPAPHVG